MKTILLLSLLTVPVLASAVNYTTLSDGNWSNNSTVWSTDGITSCSCSPDVTLNGDTVTINHNIVQDVDLFVTNNSLVTVNIDGSIFGSGRVFTLMESQFISFGNIRFKKLMVDADAQLDIYLAELYIETRLEINGTLGVHSSNLNVELGNVMVYLTGYFQLSNGSKLFFQSGNFRNSGITELCSYCCVETASGNILNEAGASMVGNGSLISDNGNIQNAGYWDSNILWCSAGTDFGMPTPEDCIGAIANCNGVPLPVELVVFEGRAEQGYNLLTWVTATETDCAYFILERSKDGTLWEERSKVSGSGTTNLESLYSVRDEVSEGGGVYYYRLLQFDYNQEKHMSNVISVVSEGTGSAHVFPNPNKGSFVLLLDELVPGTEIGVFQMNGVPVYELNEINDKKITFQLQLPVGLYLLSVKKPDSVETIKMLID